MYRISSKDSSSPHLDSLAPSAELPEGRAEAVGVGMSQGNSGAPSAFVLLVGPVASSLAVTPDHGRSDWVALDPLIGLLPRSPGASSCEVGVGADSAADV